MWNHKARRAPETRLPPIGGLRRKIDRRLIDWAVVSEAVGPATQLRIHIGRLCITPRSGRARPFDRTASVIVVSIALNRHAIWRRSPTISKALTGAIGDDDIVRKHVARHRKSVFVPGEHDDGLTGGMIQIANVTFYDVVVSTMEMEAVADFPGGDISRSSHVAGTVIQIDSHRAAIAEVSGAVRGAIDIPDVVVH